MNIINKNLSSSDLKSAMILIEEDEIEDAQLQQRLPLGPQVQLSADDNDTSDV